MARGGILRSMARNERLMSPRGEPLLALLKENVNE